MKLFNSMFFSFRLLLVFTFCLNFYLAKSQNTRFTQYGNTPLYLNPSQTGSIDYKSRFGIIYRDRWRSMLQEAAFVSGLVSYDTRYKIKKSTSLGIGGYYIFNQAGTINNKNQEINFVTSVRFTIKENHTVGFGVGIGFANNKTDGGFWPNGEIFPAQSKGFIELNSGLLWEYSAKSNFKTELGISIDQFNEPNISFFEASITNKRIRLNIHSRIQIPLSNTLSIIPSFNCSDQGPHETCIYGGFTKVKFKTSKTLKYIKPGFFLGAGRQFDGDIKNNNYSIITEVGLKSVIVGIAYDKHKTLNSEAYEVSISYIIGNN